MRSQMKSLGHKEWVHLPLWMRTSQDTSGVPLGYTMAVPVCYCKPNTSALIKKRISDKSIKFRNIQFTIDRYQISNSKVSGNTFTGDGSTTSFDLGELVHEEDIKVRKNLIEVYAGTNITADNSTYPPYLLSDTTLRSADYENEISLSHDTENKTTTITFTSAPADGSKIRVERQSDKYLAFRRKGTN